MAITNGYATLAELKHTNRLNIIDSDSVSDEMLESVIEAVSRKIDDETGRIFYITSSQTRWYTATNTEYVFVDDIASPSSDITVAIDTNDDGTVEDTFTTADYVLEPYNATIEGIPFQKIGKRKSGQYLFPKSMERAVSVTAAFGWPAVPPPIKQACLLQCERLFKRFSTPLGSESMTALGRMTLSIPSLDPDVVDLISRYKKVRFG